MASKSIELLESRKHDTLLRNTGRETIKEMMKPQTLIIEQ